MADPVGTTPFKYVTVEQDDDELVIEAGLRTPNATTNAHESNNVAASDNDTATHEHAPKEDSQAAPVIPRTNVEKNPSVGKSAENAESAFRETTLDDLEHEPMPKMQRAVLLGIAVLVVVFIAYVLFF